MHLHRIAAAALLCLAPGLAAADQNLFGRWVGQGQYAGMELVLKKDGTGSFAGEALTYQADDGVLLVVLDDEPALYRYQVQQAVLLLSGSDGELRFARAKPGTADKPAKQGAQQARGSDSLSQLLVSSAWCSFSFSGGGGGYNSGGSYGRSRSTRVQFFADGSYSASSQSDSYSSNPYGSVAGQGHGGNAGRWAVQAGQLAMSEGGGPLQPVTLQVTRNSNGYPILNADGTEYSQCN